MLVHMFGYCFLDLYSKQSDIQSDYVMPPDGYLLPFILTFRCKVLLIKVAPCIFYVA